MRLFWGFLFICGMKMVTPRVLNKTGPHADSEIVKEATLIIDKSGRLLNQTEALTNGFKKATEKRRVESKDYMRSIDIESTNQTAASSGGSNSTMKDGFGGHSESMHKAAEHSTLSNENRDNGEKGEQEDIKDGGYGNRNNEEIDGQIKDEGNGTKIHGEIGEQKKRWRLW